VILMSNAPELKLYAIRRLHAWQSPAEVEKAAARSKQVADDEFQADIRWIRSYVIAEEDGSLGTVCIYQATSPEAVRKHAHRVGMPADQILDIADTVVVRPDPVADAVAA
jgi:thiamine biosynthesis protein ThiC